VAGSDKRFRGKIMGYDATDCENIHNIDVCIHVSIGLDNPSRKLIIIISLVIIIKEQKLVICICMGRG
jgi:hypothetical protein